MCAMESCIRFLTGVCVGDPVCLLEKHSGIRIEKMGYSKEIIELSSGSPVAAHKLIFTHFNHMYPMVIYYTHTKPVLREE